MRSRTEAASSPTFVLNENVSHLLTEDLLFNPRSGIPYPDNPSDYQAIIGKILDAKGRFPGDTEALTPSGTFAQPSFERPLVPIARGPFILQGEMLSPSLRAQGVKNRFLFDADRVTQTASFGSYGTPGVSYDKNSYYVERLYKANKVVFFRFARWPVAFGGVSEFEALIAERP